MPDIATACSSYLAQSEELTALLGRDDPSRPDDLGPWIFDGKPSRVVENTSACLLVVTHSGDFVRPNEHNSATFPRLFVDIWADPSRTPQGDVVVDDAKEKIVTVHRVVKRLMHTTHLRVPPGSPAWMGPANSMRHWGTAQQIQTRTGVDIFGSVQLDGPDFSPMKENKGGWMGRYTYGVNTD